MLADFTRRAKGKGGKEGGRRAVKKKTGRSEK